MGSVSKRALFGGVAVGVLAVPAAWIVVAALGLPPAHMRLWPAQYDLIVPAWLLLVGTVLFPVLGLIVWVGVIEAGPDDTLGVPPLVICLFLVVLLGALDGRIGFASAAAVLGFTTGTIVVIARLLTAIGQGGTLGVESRWGGLGGGLGGWKLSREASLLLLAVLLVAGAVAAVRIPDRPDAASNPASPAVTTAPPRPGGAPAPKSG